MNISIGSNSLNSITANIASQKTKADNLEAVLNKTTASDEELMEACKGFEAYLLEQVFKGMEKTVMKSEEEKGDYEKQFGDMLYKNYAEAVTESDGIGLAQMLYESMKRNS
jgi:flagellar protein FlgJ